MLKIKNMIPIEKRSGLKCYFCGTELSVKYTTEIFSPKLTNQPTEVNCCNSCILTKSERETC